MSKINKYYASKIHKGGIQDQWGFTPEEAMFEDDQVKARKQEDVASLPFIRLVVGKYATWVQALENPKENEEGIMQTTVFIDNAIQVVESFDGGRLYRVNLMTETPKAPENYEDAMNRVMSMLDDAKYTPKARKDRFTEDAPGVIYVYWTGRRTPKARKAQQEYGADWKVAEGRTGQAYAIPFWDADGNELDDAALDHHIDLFLDYADKHPELTFKVSEHADFFEGDNIHKE